MTVTEIDAKPATFVYTRQVIGWICILVLLCLVIGSLTSIFWSSVLELPQYRILTDGSAAITERGLVGYVAIDAWYVICALLIGPGLGLVTWRWFKPLGWAVPIIAALAGLLTGLVCWRLGGFFGPGTFAERIAVAQPGDLVPIGVNLHAWSAVFVWPLMGVLPIMLINGFTRDPELPAGEK